MVYTSAKAVVDGRAGRAMALPLFIEKLTLNMQSFHASICQEELVGIVSNLCYKIMPIALPYHTN